MTGRELIVYILENHLEDAEVMLMDEIIKKKVSVVPIEEVAAITHLGSETINVWSDLGYLDKIEEKGRKYIVRNDKFKVFVKLQEVSSKG